MWPLALALATAAEPSSLDGTWRADLSLVHEVTVPVLGSSTTDSRTVQLWRIVDGVLTNEHCSITALTRRKLGRPTLPDAFVHSIPHASVPVQLDGDAVRIDLGVSRIGFTGDTVPTTVDDPAVIDHEGDGLPGGTITVWVPVFGDQALYVVQKTHLVLEGARLPEGGAAGRARQVELEQHTLDASNRLFARDARLEPVPESSTWRMAPVPDGTRCADLEG